MKYEEICNSWSGVEFPLMYPEASKACPTSRFVGGTSRYVCECKTPMGCAGVLKAKEILESQN